MAFREDLQDFLEERDAFVTSRGAVGGEGRFCRRNRALHVFGGAHADAADDFLGRRIDDIDGFRRDRVDPAAVDIELQHVPHVSGSSPDEPRMITHGERRRCRRCSMIEGL
jgi:hypothetical protein